MFWEDLKDFDAGTPDPSEFISRPEMMMGNQNGKGYVPTAEERERRRQTMLGVKHTAERRRNMSLAQTGIKHTAERNAKKAEINRGKHWYNNGKVNKFQYECPEGFTPGMLINGRPTRKE